MKVQNLISILLSAPLLALALLAIAMFFTVGRSEAANISTLAVGALALQTALVLIILRLTTDNKR
jgi:hypothetical protein